MIMPCENLSDCAPCPEVLANLTSEAPDQELFIGETHTDQSKTPFVPRIKDVWTSTGCLGICVSGVSQDDADLCAANQVAQCQNNNTPGSQLFPNHPESCTVTCPDGSPFTYTVPAGIVFMLSQADADSFAFQLACQRAAQFRICFGPLVRCTCIGADYSSTVLVTGGVGVIFYSVFSGSLPPGLLLSGAGHSFTISGVPVSNGTYQFTIQGVDGLGNFMRKTYTITVLEITTTQLDAFSVGVPYSFQLQAAGGSGNYLWRIVNGTLPNGLVLSNSGLISGTPV